MTTEKFTTLSVERDVAEEVRERRQEQDATTSAFLREILSNTDG